MKNEFHTVAPALQGVSFRHPNFQGTETPYFMKNVVFLPNTDFGCIYYLPLFINPTQPHFLDLKSGGLY